MKNQELREQLDARGISSKGQFDTITKHQYFSSFKWLFRFISVCFTIGLKPQLVTRLSKALKSEENDSILAENQNESNIDESEAQAGSNSSNGALECASNDSMDIDLADIVVIDEYDSTKADKTESRSKRVR